MFTAFPTGQANKSQSPKFQIQNVIISTIHCLGYWDLDIGYCLLFGVWILVFEYGKSQITNLKIPRMVTAFPTG